MKFLIKTYGIVADTVKESILKFTVITFFILSTLFLLFFYFFLSADSVSGTITTIKIFGEKINRVYELDRVNHENSYIAKNTDDLISFIHSLDQQSIEQYSKNAREYKFWNKTFKTVLSGSEGLIKFTISLI